MRVQTAILACAAATAALIPVGTALAASETRAPAPAARLAQPPAWSVVPSPNASSGHADFLNGVSCATATLCTAVGEYLPNPGTNRMLTLIESWNGTAWAVVPSPSSGGQNALSGVSCVSGGFCIAVGSHSQRVNSLVQPLTEVWDGSAWSIVSSPSPSSGGTLTAVSCLSARFCAAVGYYPPGVLSRHHHPLVEVWDGSAWSIVPSPSKGTSSALDGVSCTTAGSCTAMGDDISTNGGPSSTLVESWDGHTWSIVPSPNTGTSAGLSSVWCGPASTCVAVGDAFTFGTNTNATLVESWDGHTWSIVPSPNAGGNDNLLDGVSCQSADACIAVGNTLRQTLVESWDGSTWSIVPSPSPSTGLHHFNDLAGVSCAAASCVAAGSYGHTNPRVTTSKTLIEAGPLPAGR